MLDVTTVLVLISFTVARGAGLLDDGARLRLKGTRNTTICDHPGFPWLDARPSGSTHGDVCRDKWPRWEHWACPKGCTRQSRAVAPYCSSKARGGRPCRFSVGGLAANTNLRNITGGEIALGADISPSINAGTKDAGARSVGLNDVAELFSDCTENSRGCVVHGAVVDRSGVWGVSSSAPAEGSRSPFRLVPGYQGAKTPSSERPHPVTVTLTTNLTVRKRAQSCETSTGGNLIIVHVRRSAALARRHGQLPLRMEASLGSR